MHDVLSHMKKGAGLTRIEKRAGLTRIEKREATQPICTLTQIIN
jgi:hypothetical protein